MNQTYTKTAIALHWLIALCLITAFAIGFYMVDLRLSPNKLKIYSWHKWLGVVIFLLVILRLLWRMTHATPALPATMERWEVVVAKWVHGLLYCLMFAIPLSGWLMSSASGFQVVFLGVVPLPDLVAKNKELAAILKQLHFIFNLSLLALIGLHIGAALKHHFVVKDEVLRQMLPFLQKRR